MSIIRTSHNRDNRYLMISCEMVQDKRISPDAKGVLVYILSLEPDIKLNISQLHNALGVGENYINSAIEELENNGYITKDQQLIATNL